MMTLCLHSSSRMAADTYVKYLEEEVLLGLRGWLLEDPVSDNRTMHHATQVGESGVDCQKISATISPLTSGHLIPQIAIPLIIMCEAQLCKRPTKLHPTPNSSIYQFKQDHQKGLQNILKSSGGCGWSQW